uniref:Orf12 n=1 Tax=Staphylococcus aureus TaxID=1280 RepID=O54469_STAAU|nr:orf12 [Staphylococcus aureus]
MICFNVFRPYNRQIQTFTINHINNWLTNIHLNTSVFFKFSDNIKRFLIPPNPKHNIGMLTTCICAVTFIIKVIFFKYTFYFYK